MKIVSIFAVINESLYSVAFDDKTTDEFSDLFNNWNDVEYLNDFFEKHQTDLKSGFYKDIYDDISIEQAIQITLDEAEELENTIKSIASSGSSSLQSIFKPLDNGAYKITPLQKSKATGLNRKSWLRIYAIRIGPNMFVVSGGAIKLTETMDNREHLQVELRKLEMLKNYLTEKGVLDQDDYELLEL
ncbi:hypothetical protein [Solitalea lacus]|uniref:hypothetical protein n=1 Tax=Solitalea lacus TaxID=2911172 RepID=UPI001EDBF079|nr:hypothetical protein [Solitalea lacus]UKJ07926.1 hypothetical protein L2B55_01880 [Solitalea lacus]